MKNYNKELQLTNYPDIFSMFYSQRQRRIVRGGVVLDYVLYPGIDNLNRLRIDFELKIQDKKYRRTFWAGKYPDMSQVITLKNSKGKSFDFPAKVMYDISKYIFKIETAIENKQAVEAIFKPKLTVKEFINLHYFKIFIERLPKENYRIKHIVEYWGDDYIEAVKSIDIDYFIIKMKKRFATATVRKLCLTFREIMRLAVQLGYINRDPFVNIKMPSAKPEVNREPFNFNDLSDIFNKLLKYDKTLYEYCVLLYLTGLRSGDVVNLKHSDIQEINGIKCFVLRENKNKFKCSRDKTYIPVHKDLFQIFDFNNSDDLILKHEYCKKYIVNRFSKQFHKCFKTKETPYHFRHTFASELFKKNIPEIQINFLMGKLPAGTLQNYLRADIQTLKNAIDSIVFPYFSRMKNWECSETLPKVAVSS